MLWHLWRTKMNKNRPARGTFRTFIVNKNIISVGHTTAFDSSRSAHRHTGTRITQQLWLWVSEFVWQLLTADDCQRFFFPLSRSATVRRWLLTTHCHVSRAVAGWTNRFPFKIQLISFVRCDGNYCILRKCNFFHFVDTWHFEVKWKHEKRLNFFFGSFLINFSTDRWSKCTMYVTHGININRMTQQRPLTEKILSNKNPLIVSQLRFAFSPNPIYIGVKPIK